MTTVSQIVRQCETLLAQCVIAANEAASASALVSGAAPLDSPNFTGLPTAPTAPQNSNNFLLASTAYLDRLFGTANGVPTLDASGHIPTAQLPSSVLGGLNYISVWNASTNSPHLTSGSGIGGNFYIVGVSGSTTIDGNSTWNVGDWIVYADGATNAWQRVQPTYNPVTIPLTNLAGIATGTLLGNASGSTQSPSAMTIASVASLWPIMVGDSGSGGTKGLVPAPASGDAAANKFLKADATWAAAPSSDLSAYALLAGPAFSGTPTTATIARGTNSTALATAGFVIAQLATASETLPVVNGTASQGTSTYGARVDHIHPTDTSRASLVSPAFVGSPTAPTQSGGDNSTNISTTAWVVTHVAALGLGSAATCTVGTSANNVVALSSSAKLPAIDGSQLTNLPASGQPVPTSSTFAIGTFLPAVLQGSVVVADGATTSGSNLRFITGDFTNGLFVSTVAFTGTWKNVSGATLNNSGGASLFGYWVRTA